MKLELRRVSVTTPGAQDARRTWPERVSLLLRLSDAEGRSGIGEASPLPYYSPDTLDDVEGALRTLTPSALSAALEPASVRSALGAIGELVPASLPSGRMALETAALDLLGQRRGVPAPELLGASIHARCALAALVGPASAQTLVRDCEQALAAGYRHLKLKLGEPAKLGEEVDAVLALRKRVGAGVGLRLDANGALTSAELGEAWPRLERLDIELFEEPGDLTLPSTLPLGLDESLQGRHAADVAGLLRSRRPRCLVLKPMALGGLAHCLRLAELAREAGAGVVVSHCFDGPFAWRAAAALALSIPPGLAHGLAPHAALGAWRPTLLPVHGGALQTWTEPGLGAPAPHGFA